MSKTVVIVGSNRGIGLALVQEYTQNGWRVFAVCRSLSPQLKVLEERHSTIQVLSGVDVTLKDDLERLTQRLPKHIDEVIHNAGILRRDSIETAEDEDILDQFIVNALGPLKTLRTLKSRLASGSRVGIITSRMGSIGDCTSFGMLGYRVSKTAVNMVGKNLANAWKEDGITVLLLHPGYVRTDMTGGEGFIDPTESAQGLYLRMREHGISDTGSFLHTNGDALEW